MNSNFVSNDIITSDAKYNSIVATNKKTNALNIYLGASDDLNYAGKANGIPGFAVVVIASRINTSTMEHEVGHALNLFHTHHGSSCEFLPNNSNYCQELINGSNCGSCGDYVCDTPADPCLGGLVGSFPNCNYMGGPTQNGIPYTPMVNNIMSYAPYLCRTAFTIGQGTRMRQALLNNPMLQAFVSTGCYQINGPTLVCTTGSYSISNFPSGASVIWSTTPNSIVTFNNNTSPSPTITITNTTLSGNFTLTATISSNGSIFSVSKIIKYGKPYFFFPNPNPPNTVAVVFDPELENCNVSCYDVSNAKTYSIANAINSTSINWTKLYSLPSNYVYWNGGDNTVTVLYKTANRMIHLLRTASNTCGSISEQYEFCSNNTMCTSGLRQINTIDFKVYPNPSKNLSEITVEFINNFNENKEILNQIIELLDEKGNIILSTKITDYNFEKIKLPNLKQGIYYIRIGTQSQKILIN